MARSPASKPDVLKLLAILGPSLPGAHSLLVESDCVPLRGKEFEGLVRHAGTALRALGVAIALPRELVKLLRPKLVAVAREVGPEKGLSEALKKGGGRGVPDLRGDPGVRLEGEMWRGR